MDSPRPACRHRLPRKKKKPEPLRAPLETNPIQSIPDKTHLKKNNPKVKIF